jgi:hypothetical protein
MRWLLVGLSLLLLTGAASAKPLGDEIIRPDAIPCYLDWVTFDWDFSQGDHGFTTVAGGGAEVWEHGSTSMLSVSPLIMWATVLAGEYPDGAGQGLLSPSFLVTEETAMVEVYHYYDTEAHFDGCNVKVNGVVIPPYSGYEDTLHPDCTCVGGQEGFTGEGGWRLDCFEVAGFSGEVITLRFDFGSDGTEHSHPGWYIAAVRVGGQDPTGPEGETWGQIKGMFR